MLTMKYKHITKISIAIRGNRRNDLPFEVITRPQFLLFFPNKVSFDDDD